MTKLLFIALVSILTVSCSTEESVIKKDKESSVQKLPREHYVNLWSSHNKC